MVDADPTGLVLVRDVSKSISVTGQSQLKAGLVLDVDTGLVRGLAVAGTDADALDQAFRTALDKPAGSLPPAQPERVLCGPGLADPVTHTLRMLTALTPLPPVTEVEPGLDAEDIFDSFVGHMVGRAQPEEFAAPDDWKLLFDQTMSLLRVEPWLRWSDKIDLAVEITVAGESARYVAVIMGNAGMQHGLVLYPGEAAPDGLRAWQPERPMPMPAGTLLCLLDPPGEPPAELTAKASRYGWPAEAGLVPVFLSIGPEGGGDVSSDQVKRFTVAIAAVLAHDRRGPVLAQPATQSTADTVALANGQEADFTIFQRALRDEPVRARLPVHRAGVDLVPMGTSVVVGHLSWAALSALRADARLLHRAPADAPVPAGKEVPLVAVLPDRHLGDRLAGQLAALVPYGVAIVESDDGLAVLTVAGEDGAEVLIELEADNPGLATFRRRLRQTKGRHVLMIADEMTARGQGTVYSPFEFHQPLPPAPKKPSPRPSPARSKGGRRG